MSIFDEARQILKGGEIETKNIYFLSHLYSWNVETIGISLNINKYLGLPIWATKAMIEATVKDINHHGYITFNYRSKRKEKHKILLTRISTVMGCSTKTSKEICKILEAYDKDPYEEFGMNIKGKK